MGDWFDPAVLYYLGDRPFFIGFGGLFKNCWQVMFLFKVNLFDAEPDFPVFLLLGVVVELVVIEV